MQAAGPSVTPRRHGVVVVHGQGADRSRGDFLALVSNGIADTLEANGGRVERAFDLRGGPHATATIAVTPPAGSGMDARRFELVEAFWDDSFSPPPASRVYRWAWRAGFVQVVRTMRGWPADPTNARLGEAPDGDDGVPLPFAVTAAFWLQGLVLKLVVLVLAVLWLPVLGLLFLLDVLAGTPGLSLWGAWRAIAGVVRALDPFLTKVIGDSERYVEHGMWAASARGVLEDAVIRLLNDPGIDSVAIVAHSAGCGVSYDALLAGGPIAEAVERRGAAAAVRADGGTATLLTLVTLGSAVNRYAWISEHAGSAFARRFARDPFDPRITGVTPGAPPVAADADRARLRARFYWLDLYARLDPVPAGRLHDAVLRVVRVDPSQVKRRQVINVDNPLADHGAYFTNTGIVMPRIIRAIAGGAEPWPLPGGDSWTRAGARRHVLQVGRLQGVRLLLSAAAAAVIVLDARWERFRVFVERVHGALADAIASLPLAVAGSRPVEVFASIGLVLVLAVALLTVERLVHAVAFPDL